LPTRGPSARRAGAAGLIALSVGLVVVVLMQGLQGSGFLRVAEEASLGVVIVAAIGGLAALLAVRLAGWREPESEEDFEVLVQRSEELGRSGLFVEPDESDFMVLDPLDDADFDELVRDALDELPDLLLNALAHVAVIVSDDGARHRAYGLYQGDGATRDSTHDRIVIFRDTLRRDFGHDPDLLREQVVKTVRHELAHHVGFDELGVSRLDLG
jgi:predicted Zn-dependent protease with MMP-like domain